MIKITKIKLDDNSICYTAKFKNKTEQNKIYEYLKNIKANIICTTYLEKDGYGYYDYKLGE